MPLLHNETTPSSSCDGAVFCNTYTVFSSACSIIGITPKRRLSRKERQKDGSTLCAAEIYENVWNWLSARGCTAIVSPQLIERFAMASARWIQCETITSELGFLAKHPTTGAAIQSPYKNCSKNLPPIRREIFALLQRNVCGERSCGV